MGYQFSKWRMGPHARAYAVLASPRGYALAKEAGLSGDPQTRKECLSCHTTGASFDQQSFLGTFQARDGVQCESCHGPGSAYSTEDIMRDPAASLRPGAVRRRHRPVTGPCRYARPQPLPPRGGGR